MSESIIYRVILDSMATISVENSIPYLPNISDKYIHDGETEKYLSDHLM